MAKKEFSYRGKSLEELQKMDLKEFAQVLPARERRSLLHGLSQEQKRLLHHLDKGKGKLRTHAREMVILPNMVGHKIQVYTGKEWAAVEVTAEMIGHRLGEFALTRKLTKHSAPGIGATRSSSALSVR